MIDLLDKAQQLTPDALSVLQPLNDSHGQVGWAMQSDHYQFLLVAKDYAHKGRASFMKELVTMAAEGGAELLFYDDNTGDFTVFDAEYYLKNGTASTGDSKRGEDVSWLERPLSDGVSLNSYLYRDRNPQRISGDNLEISNY